jgi:hypothetical protein
VSKLSISAIDYAAQKLVVGLSNFNNVFKLIIEDCNDIFRSFGQLSSDGSTTRTTHFLFVRIKEGVFKVFFLQAVTLDLKGQLK